MHGHGEMVHIPFPFDTEDMKGGELLCGYIIQPRVYVNTRLDPHCCSHSMTSGSGK